MYLYTCGWAVDEMKSEEDTLVSKPDTAEILPNVIEWQLNEHHYFREYSSIDTNLRKFQHFNPVKYYSTTAAWLGNLGQAAYSNAYFENNYSSESNIFLDAYNLYHRDIENPRFYNTNRPFSYISYNQGLDDLKNVTVFHTQNVRKDFNFGGRLNYWDSQGPYVSQHSNSNMFQTFFNYDGLRYSNYIVLNFAMHRAEDMERIVNDSLILRSLGKDEEQIAVASGASGLTDDDAVHTIRRTNVLMRQERNMGRARLVTDSSKVGNLPYRNSLGHVLKFDKSEKFFVDKVIDTTLYRTYNYSSTGTDDFARSWSITNELFYKYTQVFPNESYISIQGDVGFAYDRFSYRDIGWDQVENQFLDKYIAGHLYGNLFGSYYAGVYGKYVFDGRTVNDINLNGFMQKDIIALKDSIRIKVSVDQKLHTPSFFYNHYLSNYYYWNNDFNKQNDLQLRGKISSLKGNFAIEGNILQVNNKIYVDTSGTPTQYTEGVNVSSLKLQKLTNLWKICLDNSFVFQASTNKEVIPVPDIVSYNSIYFKTQALKERLMLMFGFDVWYTTKYYAPSFNYATGLFQNQQEKQLGDYPYIDFFLKMKFKRMRAYVKYSHLNYHFMDEQYYTMLHYPQNRNSFTFGLGWHFYN